MLQIFFYNMTIKKAFFVTFALILIDNKKFNLSLDSEEINSFPGLN